MLLNHQNTFVNRFDKRVYLCFYALIIYQYVSIIKKKYSKKMHIHCGTLQKRQLFIYFCFELKVYK